MHLHRCDTPAPWCGVLERALDPDAAWSPGRCRSTSSTTRTARPGRPRARWLPPRADRGTRPPSRARSTWRCSSRCAPRYDVLIMDNRGTGRSGGGGLPAAAGGRRAHRGGHRRLRALAGRHRRVCTARRWRRMTSRPCSTALEHRARSNLYGDSYGTYFAQVFALRHPQRLRSLVLDGAYPLDGPDYAWYPHYAPAMREKFNRACERAPECRALPAATRSSTSPRRSRRCARKPFAARVRLGERHSWPASRPMPRQLAIVMFGSAPAYATRARDRCRRARLRGRGPAAAAAPHGGDTGRGGLARSDALSGAVQRRTRGGGLLRGSAADLRHEHCRQRSAWPHAMRRSRSAGPRRPDTYAPFTHR